MWHDGHVQCTPITIYTSHSTLGRCHRTKISLVRSAFVSTYLITNIFWRLVVVVVGKCLYMFANDLGAMCPKSICVEHRRRLMYITNAILSMLDPSGLLL